MRTCVTCGEKKDPSEFYIEPTERDKRHMRRSCKKCENARSQTYYWKNRDKILAQQKRNRQVDVEAKSHSKWVRNLRYKYGITEDDYYRLLEAQDGKCRLCGGDPDEDKSFVVDHCHVTGRVRWLIHSDCNLALGIIEKRGISADATAAYFRSQLELAV